MVMTPVSLRQSQNRPKNNPSPMRQPQRAQENTAGRIAALGANPL